MRPHMQILKRLICEIRRPKQRIVGRKPQQFHPPAKLADVPQGTAQTGAQSLCLLRTDLR
jgi:hypothetical protein